MNKQELIEKAVLAFEGKWLFPYENLVTPSPTNSGYAPYCKFESIKDLLSLGPHWQVVCTKEEFEACAKRIGYINGYRWGVEYPTNGKQPELDGDIRIDWFGDNEWNSTKVGYLDWSANNPDLTIVEFFKITDQRYKPVSEISESKPDAESVSKNPESNWFEAGELPPVGTEFEAYFAKDTYPAWVKAKTAYLSGEHAILIFEDGFENHYKTDELMKVAKFRPIRTDREKFGLELWRTINYNDKKLDDEILKSSRFEDYCHAYDAGFRLPESE